MLRLLGSMWWWWSVVDRVVRVTEVDVLACGAGSDEHPAMTMAMTAADRTAADLINLAVAGLTADVTALLLLLSPAGSGGGCPNTPCSAEERSGQKERIRGQCHPERHPPMPGGGFCEDFSRPDRRWAAQPHAEGRLGLVRFSRGIQVGG